MQSKIDASNVWVGVVGLGLMGCSIVVSLLKAGHRVVAIAPVAGEMSTASLHIGDLLQHAHACNLLPNGIAASIEALAISEDYGNLTDCVLVMECVIENKAIKEEVYGKIAGVVRPDAVIASNTSAIPISDLQVLVPNPSRFLGIHWAEPAYLTRFLEVTCGQLTNLAVAEYVMELSKIWGKEPTLLKKDIRGFITNRLMYAVYREALSLVEGGHGSLEAMDKAFRYDVGSWITLMGIFRRLDFVGLDDYIKAFVRIFEGLDNRENVPERMRQLVAEHAKGIYNQKGLYTYTKEGAQVWEKRFAQFNSDIYELAARYPEREPLATKEDIY